jgi:hypothetical protein
MCSCAAMQPECVSYIVCHSPCEQRTPGHVRFCGRGSADRCEKRMFDCAGIQVNALHLRARSECYLCYSIVMELYL